MKFNRTAVNFNRTTVNFNRTAVNFQQNRHEFQQNRPVMNWDTALISPASALDPDAGVYRPIRYFVDNSKLIFVVWLAAPFLHNLRRFIISLRLNNLRLANSDTSQVFFPYINGSMSPSRFSLRAALSPSSSAVVPFMSTSTSFFLVWAADPLVCFKGLIHVPSCLGSLPF